MFKFNSEKGQEVHKNYLREARKEKFKELDIAFMQAIEENNSSLIEEIKTKKQQLRDITALPEIKSAQTEEDFKNIWPDILN